MSNKFRRIRNARISKAVCAVVVVATFATACGAPEVETVIRSGRGDIVVDSDGE